MVTKDIISLFLSTLLNNQKAQLKSFTQPKIQLLLILVDILYSNGFLSGYRIEENKILIFLKYTNGKPFINKITRISKPSKRVYWSLEQLKLNRSPHTIFLLSTSKGILTDYAAILANVGGEVLAKIE